MKVNYVLMYGIPYVRYKEFETFEDISNYLVHKGFVNYSIFKKLEDNEEVEMIYRDNDIRYLENFVKEQDIEIERLHSIIKEVREDMEDVRERYNYYGNDNFDLSILSFWIEKLEILDKENNRN